MESECSEPRPTKSSLFWLLWPKNDWTRMIWVLLDLNAVMEFLDYRIVVAIYGVRISVFMDCYGLQFVCRLSCLRIVIIFVLAFAQWLKETGFQYLFAIFFLEQKHIFAMYSVWTCGSASVKFSWNLEAWCWSSYHVSLCLSCHHAVPIADIHWNWHWFFRGQ